MPKFSVESKSSHSAQDTLAKLKTLFEEDRDLRKMDSSYVCKFDDANLKGSAKGSKFDATMEIKDNPGSVEVFLNVSIPLMLTPFKGMIKETLEKKLNKALS